MTDTSATRPDASPEAPAPAKPRRPFFGGLFHRRPQPPYIAFRTYSELPCFLPPFVLALILWPLRHFGIISDATVTHLWLPVFFLAMLAVCVDLNWIVTVAILAILILVVPASQYVGIEFVHRLFDLIGREEGTLDMGVILTLAKWYGVACLVVWVARRFTYYEVSPNLIQRVVLGSKDWTERNFTVSTVYENAYKLLFLGMGKLIIQGANSRHEVDDVFGLAWWRGRRIEAILKETAVLAVAPPPEE